MSLRSSCNYKNVIIYIIILSNLRIIITVLVKEKIIHSKNILVIMQSTVKNNIINVHVVTAKSYCIQKRNGLH